jgi:hypothetical protein
MWYILKLDDVIYNLKLQKYREILDVGWSDSQKAMPGEMSILEDDSLKNAAKILSFPDKIIYDILRAAFRIRQSKEHSALLWYFHHRLFISDDVMDKKIKKWPCLEILEESLQDDANMFYYIVLLSGMRFIKLRMEKAQNVRAIPSEIIVDTLADMAGDLEDYKKMYGGLPPGSLGFRVNINFGGEYFRLGRLSFHLTESGAKIRVFRNLSGGNIVVLSEDGIKDTEDGQKISGYPIVPNGTAEKEQILLHKREWEQELAPGDTVLDMHIPGGMPLEFEECGKAMVSAIAFFKKHFPQKQAAAFTCFSWLMDTRLQELLPCDSNIIRFQKEFYLFPAIADDDILLKNIAGGRKYMAQHSQKQTSLQRRLFEKINADEDFHASAGGCFLLFRDFDWGKRVYRQISAIN